MDLTCRDVMVPSAIQRTVSPDASVATAFNIIKQSRARFLPVVAEDGTYMGVFSAPTLLKLFLPKAALINQTYEPSKFENLNFFSLSKADFEKQLESLRYEKVVDNMSLPANIPVAAPDTPIMEGIYKIHKYKRHLMLVEPGTGKFIGSVSANSILDQVLGDKTIEE